MKFQHLKVLIVTVLTVDSRIFPEEPKDQSFIEHVKAVSKNISKNIKYDPNSDMEGKMKKHHSVSSSLVQTRANTSSENGEGHHSGEVLNTDTNDTRPLITRKGKGKSRSEVCAAGEVLVGGQCLTFSKKRLNWQKASTACSAAGGRLATLENPAAVIDYAVQTYGAGNVHFWVGGSDIEEEGTWVWSNDAPISDGLPWSDNEPNSCCGGEDCLQVTQGGYNDDGCWDIHQYICEPVCAAGEVLVGGQCLTFSKKRLNWQKASTACSAAGGRLATLENPAAVIDYAVQTYGADNANGKFWIGGSDIGKEGTWMWSNGVPIRDDFPWEDNEPNDWNNNEDCLELTGAGYNDNACTVKFRYICEPAGPGVSNCVCGQANRASRIVNGRETEENKYPWQAALVFYGSSSVFCGGSVIGSKHILTAAHCTQAVTDYSLSYQVLVGAHGLTTAASSQLRLEPTRFIQHADYHDSTYDNDISIIELNDHIDFTSSEVRPVCLPNSDANSYDSVTATVSGWGDTEFGGSQPDVHLEVDVPTMSNTQCKEYYEPRYEITDNMMCAGYEEGGKDSCHGDSGGPLVYNSGSSYTQIGVVSWGWGCAWAGNPGVYARVTEYLSWIADNSASSNTCPAT